MTIGLICEGGANWVGGIEYMRNLILAVRATEQVNSLSATDFVIIDASGDQVPGTFADMMGVRLAAVRRERRGLIARLRQRVGLPNPDRSLDRLCHEEAIDFLYPHDRSFGQVTCRSLAWIPDLQHHWLPEFFSAAEIEHRNSQFRRIADECPGVVFSSRAVLSDFQSHYPNARAKTCVVPFRVSVDSEVLQADPWGTVTRYNLPGKFILVSNQLWQHKNHMLLLEALARAQQPEITVVMTGRLHDYRRPTFADEVAARIHTLGVHAQVRLLGLIPKRDQIQLLRAAHAIVQPSLFEGWNTGVEEARSLGKSIILSRIPAHSEQSPANCVYFDPRNATELAEALGHLWVAPIQKWSRGREEVALREYGQLVADYGSQILNLAVPRRSGGIAISTPARSVEAPATFVGR